MRAPLGSRPLCVHAPDGSDWIVEKRYLRLPLPEELDGWKARIFLAADGDMLRCADVSEYTLRTMGHADSCDYPSGVSTLRMTIAFDEPDEEGWIVARVVEVPGALSQGRSREEARENVIDALRLMLTPDDGDPSVVSERTEPLDLTMVA